MSQLCNAMLMSGSNLILDSVNGSSLAYSFRRLSSSYLGKAVNVRRSSDNAQQDIGFVNGNFDINSYLSFIGVGNGFVAKWYDQSGNGKDLLQGTLGNQPQIFTNVSALNNRTSPNFTSQILSVASGFPSSSDFSTIGLLTVHDPTGGNRGIYGSNSNTHAMLFASSKESACYMNNGFYAFSNTNVIIDAATLSTHIWDNTLGQSTVFQNTVQVAQQTTAGLNNDASFILGSYGGSTASALGGYIPEMIIYPFKLSTSQRNFIEANQTIYYE